MLGLLSRTTSNFKNPVSSNAWSPETPLPSGFTSTLSTFAVPISPTSSFLFESTGHYAKGTILVEVEESPPGYEESMREKVALGGFWEAKVVVEARGNDEKLMREGTVEVVGCGIALTSPAAASRTRLGVSLSYHFTITLPPLPFLTSFAVSANRFRIVAAPSFSSLHLGTLSLTTSDAPITLAHELKLVEKVTIRNQNRLDSTKEELKHFEALLTCAGLRTPGPISIALQNGALTGTFASASSISATTTNAPLDGTFTSLHGSLSISTSTGAISGTFLAKEGTVELSNRHGKIEGTFEGQHVVLSTWYQPVVAKITASQGVAILTASSRVDAEIEFAPSGPVPGDSTPTPSVLEGVQPPTFAQATTPSTPTVFVSTVETSEAGMSVSYGKLPPGLVLRSTVKSSGGGRVEVTHNGGNFVGTFLASTSALAQAVLDLETAAGRVIGYSAKKRNEVAGWVGWADGRRAVGEEMRTEASNTNGVVSILVR